MGELLKSERGITSLEMAVVLVAMIMVMAMFVLGVIAVGDTVEEVTTSEPIEELQEGVILLGNTLGVGHGESVDPTPEPEVVEPTAVSREEMASRAIACLETMAIPENTGQGFDFWKTALPEECGVFDSLDDLEFYLQ